MRVRLRDPRLRRLIESVDICQSVLATFFVRAALGQYDLENPDQLLKLLVTIAPINWPARRAGSMPTAETRGESIRRGDRGVSRPREQPQPSSVQPRDRPGGAKADDAEIARDPARREQGLEWAEIAAEMGGSPDALRIRFSRAVARITRELGLDEGLDE